MVRDNRHLLLLVAVGFGLNSCGGTGSDPSSPQSSVAVGGTVGGPSVTTSPDYEDAPVAAAILSDGEVSHAEMERALLAAVECVEAAGYEATYEFRPREGFEFGAVETADPVVESCMGSIIDPVFEVYSEQHGPSPAEIADRNAKVDACIADRLGEDLSGLTRDEIFDRGGVMLFNACEENNPYPPD